MDTTILMIAMIVVIFAWLIAVTYLATNANKTANDVLESIRLNNNTVTWCKKSVEHALSENEKILKDNKELSSETRRVVDKNAEMIRRADNLASSSEALIATFLEVLNGVDNGEEENTGDSEGGDPETPG